MADRKEIPSQKKIFIVLEGLSGSGKTTVGQLVAERMGAEFYRTPASLFNSFRDEVDKNADAAARLFFYLAGVIQASVEISRILKTKSVVCDRYLLTTLCYHRALGITINVPDYVFEQLLKPDYTFLIACEEVKRIHRLRKRGLSYNDAQEQNLQIEQRFLFEYRKYCLDEIDNSNDNPIVAVNTILHFIYGVEE